MESLFFNTPTQRYQSSALVQGKRTSLDRVDISNGIFFYHGNVGRQGYRTRLQGIDRMVMIAVAREGEVSMEDHLAETVHRTCTNQVVLYVSTRQDITLQMHGEVFLLCVADFFLKRYLSFDPQDPIDHFYGILQQEHTLKKIALQRLDALSLYTIDKIIQSAQEQQMRSLYCMQRVIEWILHHFALLEPIDTAIDPEERQLASRARAILLDDFRDPPTIAELAHLCATNSTRLKKVFKRVYGVTIYGMVQRLRLEEANLLLREEKLTIGEIAARVGYRHQGHFSKRFFATYGIYPKDLQRRR